MNGIIGLTRIIKETSLTTYQQEMVDRMGAAARSLFRIINDILDFSKVVAGKLEIENIVFPFKDALPYFLGLSASQVGENKLQLTMSDTEDLPLYYRGDPLRLNQVLTNLLSNAIKFTEKGSIHLSRICEYEGTIQRFPGSPG